MTYSTNRARSLFATVWLCALVVLGSACTSGRPDPASGTKPAPYSRTPAARPDGRLNATDIGWTQLMIALDSQAVGILRLAPSRSGNPELRNWAAELADSRSSQLSTLRRLLADAGVHGDNPHEGHDMPGMVNAQELRALTTAHGSRFDQLLREALEEHLSQSGKLAASVREADADPGVKRIARTVEQTSATARRHMPSARRGSPPDERVRSS
ncbi:hypothetical protein SRB5_09240 [Streptomyces sp. RB5]|uniref:DUF305 domain-containing protein n=1 Tax=Streptomyces smaragdinus TaxID=2585196 RepID=A0A7K0CBH6_9ACTN|nr:DUF305 domain-containing protein [Streptomyces smaragdinus]MQY10811.1 hypothetical protein [Streptomyces smaragdinus]